MNQRYKLIKTIHFLNWVIGVPFLQIFCYFLQFRNRLLRNWNTLFKPVYSRFAHYNCVRFQLFSSISQQVVAKLKHSSSTLFIRGLRITIVCAFSYFLQFRNRLLRNWNTRFRPCLFVVFLITIVCAFSYFLQFRNRLLRNWNTLFRPLFIRGLHITIVCTFRLWFLTFAFLSDRIHIK